MSVHGWGRASACMRRTYRTMLRLVSTKARDFASKAGSERGREEAGKEAATSDEEGEAAAPAEEGEGEEEGVRGGGCEGMAINFFILLQ